MLNDNSTEWKKVESKTLKTQFIYWLTKSNYNIIKMNMETKLFSGQSMFGVKL